eukprot:g7717.t1
MDSTEFHEVQPPPLLHPPRGFDPHRLFDHFGDHFRGNEPGDLDLPREQEVDDGSLEFDSEQLFLYTLNQEGFQYKIPATKVRIAEDLNGSRQAQTCKATCQSQEEMFANSHYLCGGFSVQRKQKGISAMTSEGSASFSEQESWCLSFFVGYEKWPFPLGDAEDTITCRRVYGNHVVLIVIICVCAVVVLAALSVVVVCLACGGGPRARRENDIYGGPDDDHYSGDEGVSDREDMIVESQGEVVVVQGEIKDPYSWEFPASHPKSSQQSPRSSPRSAEQSPRFSEKQLSSQATFGDRNSAARQTGAKHDIGVGCGGEYKAWPKDTGGDLETKNMFVNPSNVKKKYNEKAALMKPEAEDATMQIRASRMPFTDEDFPAGTRSNNKPQMAIDRCQEICSYSPSAHKGLSCFAFTMYSYHSLTTSGARDEFECVFFFENKNSLKIAVDSKSLNTKNDEEKEERHVRALTCVKTAKLQLWVYAVLVLVALALLVAVFCVFWCCCCKGSGTESALHAGEKGCCGACCGGGEGADQWGGRASGRGIKEGNSPFSWT